MHTGAAVVREEILRWLREDDPAQLDVLYRRADRIRNGHVGDEVHLRGLIEISNHCVRQCAYCGINAGNRSLVRYRMTQAEILECARTAKGLGYGTVVLQAGEDYGITGEWLAQVVRQIKSEADLAVTLSMGERPDTDLELWRRAGADRYLLRFETSDPVLFERIHPPHGTRTGRSRIEILRRLQALGYEAGSGVMVGIPGQSYDSLARDIELFRELDLDMIGIGPYIPHPSTRLASGRLSPGLPPSEQVPNTEEMVYKSVALARLACPQANIPSTSALATINLERGRELGLQRGANVVMPNLTPPRYRHHYEIYPNKACIGETPADCSHCLRNRIRSLGRRVGAGHGGRVRSGATR